MLTSSYKIYEVIETEFCFGLVWFFTITASCRPVGMLINNVIVVCVWFFGGGGGVTRLGRLISTCVCVHCDTPYYICTCVIVHTHCIMGHNIQCFFPSPPPSEIPSPLLHQPYRGRPLILARSGVGQKETSAH